MDADVSVIANVLVTGLMDGVPSGLDGKAPDLAAERIEISKGTAVHPPR